MPSCPISIATDFAIQVTPSGHNFAPAPPPAPPPLSGPAALALEIPTPQLWPPGFGSHKQTKTVVHKMMPICQDGHDIGRFCPHIHVVPAPSNALLPLIMFKSSRKNNFKAPTVKANKEPIGTFVLINWPPMPMTSCGEPLSLPQMCSTTSWTNNVMVGMTWASYIISALTLAANLLIDRYLAKRDQALKDAGILDEIKEIRKIKFLGGLMSIDDMAAFGLKSAVAAASSVARLALTNEDGSFPLLAGGPFGIEITRSEEGKYGVKGTAKVSKGDNSLTASAAASEDGSVEGSVKVSRESKTGKDKYGEDATTENSVGISGKKDKDGNVEASADASQKRSQGDSKSAGVKYSEDKASGKSSVSAEAGRSDRHGNEGKVGVEHTTNEKTGETTDKVGASGKSAAGSAEVSSEGTTDKAGNTTATETASMTPAGQDTSKAEHKSTYPATPKVSNQPSGINQGPHL